LRRRLGLLCLLLHNNLLGLLRSLGRLLYLGIGSIALFAQHRLGLLGSQRLGRFRFYPLGNREERNGG
jgi:hypothetical protein